MFFRDVCSRRLFSCGLLPGLSHSSARAFEVLQVSGGIHIFAFENQAKVGWNARVCNFIVVFLRASVIYAWRKGFKSTSDSPEAKKLAKAMKRVKSHSCFRVHAVNCALWPCLMSLCNYRACPSFSDRQKLSIAPRSIREPGLLTNRFWGWCPWDNKPKQSTLQLREDNKRQCKVASGGGLRSEFNDIASCCGSQMDWMRRACT